METGTINGKLLPFAASVRVANLPGVVTNVSAGAMIATTRPDLVLLAGACFAGILLCAAGNLGNDLMDRKWDFIHRPERALPRGVFSPSFYAVVTALCAAGAMAVLAVIGMLPLVCGAAILLCAGIYTWIHKKSSAGIFFMGMCRALLPVLGAFAVSGGVGRPAVLVSAGLFCYTAGLSLFARGESKPLPIGKRFLLPVMLAPVFPIVAHGIWLFGLATALLFWGWLLPLLKPGGNVGAKVSRMLAGMPLLDAVAIVPLAVAAFSGGWMCISFVVFFFARRLQRFAAAT